MVLLSIYENNVRVKYPFCYFLSYQSDPLEIQRLQKKKLAGLHCFFLDSIEIALYGAPVIRSVPLLGSTRLATPRPGGPLWLAWARYGEPGRTQQRNRPNLITHHHTKFA